MVTYNIEGKAIMSLRTVILRIIESVAGEQLSAVPHLIDETPLYESGLDSLCWGIIVARLEDLLGRDPFSEAGDMPLPITIGDFIAVYEQGWRGGDIALG